MKVCVISDFRCDVGEICALMEYGAALDGRAVPTFQDNLSVPSSRVRKSKKGFHNTLWRLVRNYKVTEMRIFIVKSVFV
jgi:hypothetical protein